MAKRETEGDTIINTHSETKRHCTRTLAKAETEILHTHTLTKRETKRETLPTHIGEEGDRDILHTHTLAKRETKRDTIINTHSETKRHYTRTLAKAETEIYYTHTHTHIGKEGDEEGETTHPPWRRGRHRETL